ncbi:MAG: class I SAM-dependent methyltransferase [Candidatus Woesebacteria bacterium]|nr:class I SAM-dependent methyltransferase [Candidatus Woesebacteria bacterium]
MDYELIDSGNGRRLERFGKYVLNRPDPEVMWSKNLSESEWEKADAKFIDKWITNTNFPDKWPFEINSLKVNLKLTPFKHVGIFPEQEFQWQLIQKLIANSQRPFSVLNLFGYTGVASLFALKAGAKVTHVDASRPAITWFTDNKRLSGLEVKPARIIIDDCIKFTSREIKRGVKYDGIIMDPPVYGHGPHGEKWSFSKNFPELLDNVSQLLSDNPLFVIVNAYAISSSSTSLANMLIDKLPKSGSVTNGELTLKEKSSGRLLSTGIWSMWTK